MTSGTGQPYRIGCFACGKRLTHVVYKLLAYDSLHGSRRVAVYCGPCVSELLAFKPVHLYRHQA